MIRIVMVFSVAVLLLTGCYKKQVEVLEVENEQLVNNAVNLHEEAAVRDTLIQDVSLLIHDIYHQFNEVDAAHKVVIGERTDTGLNRSQLWRKRGTRLLGKLKNMDDRLEKNKQSIQHLRALIRKNKMQVSRLNVVVAQLESTNVAKQKQVATLESEIVSQGEEITRLHGEVSDKDVTIQERETVIEEHEMTIEEQDKILNTKYYIVGTKKELLAKGVLTKKGGILGLGATLICTPGNGVEAFSTIQKTDDIIVADAPIKEVLPLRTKRSYGLEFRDDSSSLIHIVDPSLFWESSLYVVVLVK